jgi:site-specific DNA-adenine methylase
LDELIRQTLYNKVKQTDYIADNYLNDIEIVKADYMDLYNKYNSDKTVFFVDPPYLSTDVKTYISGIYWKLKDYLNVLKILEKSNYIYFTSEKSQIVELCEWIGRNKPSNPFADAEVKGTQTKCSHNSKYTDVMLSRKIFY